MSGLTWYVSLVREANGTSEMISKEIIMELRGIHVKSYLALKMKITANRYCTLNTVKRCATHTMALFPSHTYGGCIRFAKTSLTFLTRWKTLDFPQVCLGEDCVAGKNNLGTH